MDDAQVKDLIGQMTRRGLTVATAESLTGGGLVARMVDVPGASHVVRGGACTYAVDTKASVLGVSRARLDQTGPVDEQVARQMAEGARVLCRCARGLGAGGGGGPRPRRWFPCRHRSRCVRTRGRDGAQVGAPGGESSPRAYRSYRRGFGAVA